MSPLSVYYFLFILFALLGGKKYNFIAESLILEIALCVEMQLNNFYGLLLSAYAFHLIHAAFIIFHCLLLRAQGIYLFRAAMKQFPLPTFARSTNYSCSIYSFFAFNYRIYYYYIHTKAKFFNFNERNCLFTY